jgi:hypothetical protein
MFLRDRTSIIQTKLTLATMCVRETAREYELVSHGAPTRAQPVDTAAGELVK